MDENRELPFETAIAQLEEVVRHLEQGDLTLEEALRCFQEGVRLVGICNRRLQAAENQVEILLQQLGDRPSEEGGSR
ncbi:MAG: exodeoxyribonuclease VII small subunit [Syntrophomonadaceae bacterium]|nr:exodeoxyribonuclease VII small subunit [Syntrophomonadaceae bacterium]